MNMHLPDALTIRDMFLGNLDLQLTVDFCLRLLLSCVCGGAIGIERSKHFKEAGVRTHVIVCMGAALAMIVSKYGFADLAMDNGSYFPGTKETDPARVAAQVISGISFLGAGVIFKREGLVRGLTTAAGIWVTAAIGLAVGSGMLVVGLASVIIGQVFFGNRGVTLGILSAVAGSLVYRVSLQVAYKVEMPSYAVKLLSAVIVVIALTIPRIRRLAAQRRADREEDAA